MAQLGNLLVTGSSRLLGKLFCEDINISNSLVVKTLNATDVTAHSVTTSALTVNGNATTTGTLNVGNSQANGKISVNGKVAIRDYGYNWLGINDGYAESWSTQGVFFGKSIIRTDTAFQLGSNGDKVLLNTSSAKFNVPVTINNSLAANNITATNVTINDTLKAFKYELNTIQDLGDEFCVAPTIYIQPGATVNVSKASSTTITVSILDKTAITSDSIQGVRWAQNSKIKFQGKIDGLHIRCSGIMAAKLNTTANTMSLTLTVESAIADHFATAKNGVSYSDISVMLYQRYGKKIGSTDNAYSYVGIRMSATGSVNAAPYIDIWGSKSSSDPDTVYTIPSVRLGYLDGLTCGGYSCNGYGLYADNVYLNGTIISKSGTIGQYKITDSSLIAGNGDTCTGMGGNQAFWAGNNDSNNAPFHVGYDGSFYASKANITGSITATTGKLAGWTIEGCKLYCGSKITGTTESLYTILASLGSDSTSDAIPVLGIGCTDNSFSDAKFLVNSDGHCELKDIAATGGTIGAFNISHTALSYGEVSDDNIYEKIMSTNINDNNVFLLSPKNVGMGTYYNYLYIPMYTGVGDAEIKSGRLRFSCKYNSYASLDNNSLEIMDSDVDPWAIPFNSAEIDYLKDNGTTYYSRIDSDVRGFVSYYAPHTIALKRYDKYPSMPFLEYFYLGLKTTNSCYTDGDAQFIKFDSTVLSFGTEKKISIGGLYQRGNLSSIFGYQNLAVGRYSLSGGQECESYARASFSYGLGLYTDNVAQTVIGRYNKHHLKSSSSITSAKDFINAYSENGIESIDSSAFIIGNGSDTSNRSNAFTVDWDGNTWAAGSITAIGSVKGTDFNGFTINKSIPSDAKFTDTVTTIVNSCDSDSTTSALSAAQGKSLKAYIDSYFYPGSKSSYSFTTEQPLFLNGNCLNHNNAQLLIQHNDSVIRFRNDGGSFYIMNGNTSSWTNYISFDTGGNVVVPRNLTVTNGGWLYVPSAIKASTTSAANAYISSDTGVLAKTSKTSSRRFKDSITPELDDDLNPEHLYDVDVIQFKYKKDYFTNEDDIRYRKNMIGLIAEDVYDKYKIAADWHVDEDSGEVLVDGWNNQYMIPAMLKLIQEQHKEIEKLKQIIGGE